MPNDFILLKGARQNNLRNIDVEIPLGLLVCVTGVSGSGKSTLVNDILYRRLANYVHGASVLWGDHDDIEGKEAVDKVIDIDQSPIGRTPRSRAPILPSVNCSPLRERLAPEVTNQDVSASTSKEGGVKLAKGMGSSKSRCTSCLMSTCRVRCAKVNATIGRRWKCATKKRTSARCWR